MLPPIYYIFTKKVYLNIYGISGIDIQNKFREWQKNNHLEYDENINMYSVPM